MRGDVAATFYHDVSPELAAALKRGRAQPETPTRKPWPLQAWPDVPTRFLLSRDDRLLPSAFLRRVGAIALGHRPDEIDGGHCVAPSRSKELAEHLDAYRAEHRGVVARVGSPTVGAGTSLRALALDPSDLESPAEGVPFVREGSIGSLASCQR